MARSSIRAKASRASTTTTTTSSSLISTSTRNPKKAARLARHSSFVTRIEKSSSSSSTTAASSSSRHRHRRAAKASKSLISTLESLADALPTDEISSSVNFTSRSSRAAAAQDGSGGGGEAAKKGLKSRPGAMKRKEKLIRSECERFGKNLAIMTELGTKKGQGGGAVEAVPTTTPTTTTTTGSWHALRTFIGVTLEKKEEFVEMEGKARGEVEMQV